MRDVNKINELHFGRPLPLEKKNLIYRFLNGKEVITILRLRYYLRIDRGNLYSSEGCNLNFHKFPLNSLPSLYSTENNINFFFTFFEKTVKQDGSDLSHQPVKSPSENYCNGTMLSDAW